MHDNKHSLRDQVRELILGRVEKDFHTPSRTHMYFHLGPGPEVKGFGDWPAPALEDFETRLNAAIGKAAHGQLVEWKEALAGRACAAALSAECSGQIFMTWSKSVHELLSTRARPGKMNELVCEVVSAALPTLEKRLLGTDPSRVRDEIASRTKPILGDSPRDRTNFVIRPPKELHGLIQHFAQKLSVPQTELCRFLVSKAMDERETAKMRAAEVQVPVAFKAKATLTKASGPPLAQRKR